MRKEEYDELEAHLRGVQKFREAIPIDEILDCLRVHVKEEPKVSPMTITKENLPFLTTSTWGTGASDITANSGSITTAYLCFSCGRWGKNNCRCGTGAL